IGVPTLAPSGSPAVCDTQTEAGRHRKLATRIKSRRRGRRWRSHWNKRKTYLVSETLRHNILHLVSISSWRSIAQPGTMLDVSSGTRPISTFKQVGPSGVEQLRHFL